MSAAVLSPDGVGAPYGCPTSAAEYVRREKRAGTLLSVAVFGCIFLGVVLVVPLLAWATLYGRSTRRGWIEYLRGQAAAAAVPLADDERRVLRRALGRRRVGAVVVLVLAAFCLLVALGALVGMAGSGGGAVGVGVGLFALLLFAGLGGVLVRVGLRLYRDLARLIARVEGPGEVLGMRLRAPFVGRRMAAPPRLGGIPLLVIDPKWHKALQAADGREVELVLAPTFADDPKGEAPRVPVALPVA